MEQRRGEASRPPALLVGRRRLRIKGTNRLSDGISPLCGHGDDSAHSLNFSSASERFQGSHGLRLVVPEALFRRDELQAFAIPAWLAAGNYLAIGKYDDIPQHRRLALALLLSGG